MALQFLNDGYFAGKVGIGTESPDRKLHVNSGSTNIVATFESTDATAAISLQDNSTTNDSKVQIRAILKPGFKSRGTGFGKETGTSGTNL